MDDLPLLHEELPQLELKREAVPKIKNISYHSSIYQPKPSSPAKQILNKKKEVTNESIEIQKHHDQINQLLLLKNEYTNIIKNLEAKKKNTTSHRDIKYLQEEIYNLRLSIININNKINNLESEIKKLHYSTISF